jgi:general secretion pathway protein B
MSYILDALRKADAERDRGNVPGIHAQPSFGGPQPTSAQPAAKPWLWLAGGAAAVLVIGGLAWYLVGAPRSPVVATAAPPAPAPIAAAPPPVAAAPVTPAPIEPPVSQPIKLRPEAAAPTVHKARPAAAPASAASANEAKPAAAGEKVYAIAELPDDIRGQLPKVAVGGSMYSAKPADRILIINGQVLHEGDKIAPELTLQQIRLKGALLNFKGYRYTIAF